MSEKLSNEQIAALRDGCEGVTPGEWEYYSHEPGGWRAPESPAAMVNSNGDKVIDCTWACATEYGERTYRHIANCDPDTIRALATEVLESRDALAEHEAAKEQAHQEGYDEGYREGQSDAAGAQSDLWRMMLRYFDKHGIEPASDDGEGYSAHQMMDALHEHESEVDAAHQAEIARLNKEKGIAVGELRALLSDPNAVHVNMLRGQVAKPSWEQMKHLRPEESVAELEALLDVDRLTDIITDSIDLDWTPRDAAKAIVRAMGGDAA